MNNKSEKIGNFVSKIESKIWKNLESTKNFKCSENTNLKKI